MYGKDIKDMIIFLLLMFLTFWFVPGIISFCFRGDKQYDGELFVKDRDDEGTNYILRLHKIADLPNKKELTINVRHNDPEQDELEIPQDDE